MARSTENPRVFSRAATTLSIGRPSRVVERSESGRSRRFGWRHSRREHGAENRKLRETPQRQDEGVELSVGHQLVGLSAEQQWRFLCHHQLAQNQCLRPRLNNHRNPETAEDTRNCQCQSAQVHFTAFTRRAGCPALPHRPPCCELARGIVEEWRGRDPGVRSPGCHDDFHPLSAEVLRGRDQSHTFPQNKRSHSVRFAFQFAINAHCSKSRPTGISVTVLPPVSFYPNLPACSACRASRAVVQREQ